MRITARPGRPRHHRSAVPNPYLRRGEMSFSLYFLGFLLLIVGVAWGLVTAGVPTIYVLIASVILLGLGIMSGVTRTRTKDRPQDPPA
jgi:uncharacterized membrane protein SpoIIM required for sporulation